MAKKSNIAKNRKRMKTVEKYAEQRAELKSIIKSSSSTAEEIQDAQFALQQLPRDASPVSVRNRCDVTGRPRGYHRKFGLSRIALRELALKGELPGVVKSSW